MADLQMMSYMGISLALAMLAKLWLRPRRVNCGRCFLRDEACKEFGGVVRTHKSSVLICKDAAAVPIGIFQKSTAILIQWVFRISVLFFGLKSPDFKGVWAFIISVGSNRKIACR